MREDLVIKVSSVSKTYKVHEKSNDSVRDRIFGMFSKNSLKKVHSLKDVSFEVKKGEFLGVIGRNGSGKSTLLNIIMGCIKPDEGSIDFSGTMIRLALGLGFDLGLTARENIYVNASILGLTFREIGRRFNEIIEFAGIQEFVDVQVKYFSSGMRSRLSFAIAIQSDADIILIDEFFGGVGDIEFKEKSERVFKERLVDGKTIIHVNHNLNIIREHSDRVIVIEKGRLISDDFPNDAIKKYRELMQNK